MSDQSDDRAAICEIMGCSGECTTTRWVITEDQGKLALRVCSTHAEGEIDSEKISAGT